MSVNQKVQGDEKMSVAANVISAAIKSVVGDKIGNELAKEVIGISIDGVSENGINKINDFISGEKAKIEHILSKENMRSMNIPENAIDHVVEEIKDLFKSIEITDEVLRQCKYESMKLKDFLWDEYCGYKGHGYIECESYIKKGLLDVSEALLKLMYESENFEKDVLIHISNSVDDMRLEEQTNTQNIMKRFDKIEESTQAIYDKVSEGSDTQKKNIDQKEVKSRTQEYLDKWNANMFLNDFSEWDENAGVNVKLKDVYIEAHLPHFIWGSNSSESIDLKRLLSKYIYEKDENKMLLILGQPGIGKSTLITWIAANFSDRVDDILVYKFASDLKNIRWKDSNDLADYILNELNLSYNDLDGKTLIIDGFDEIRVEERILLLNRWHWSWVLGDLSNNFSLIITCRENYIQDLYRVHSDYITLQQWDEIQIKSFCDIFQEKTKKSVSDATIERFIENRAILGIPLILYMVLALEISIEKDGSIVDVYDKIFSLDDGGIYARCLQNKSYEAPHRIGDIKNQIHQISREIAIWMFENDPDKACIPQEEYEKICNCIMKDCAYGKEDFKIGNFFKSVKHCEEIETEELYFVHRSIYEYFVAETIYSSIENAMVELSEESQEEFAEGIAKYLKQGEVSNTIGEYLQHKTIKLYKKLDYRKKQIFYQWWESAIGKLLNDGMFYYTRESICCYKNIITKEICCFKNLIKILQLISGDKKKYILENIDRRKLEMYIRHCGADAHLSSERLFRKVYSLEKICMMEINLNEAFLAATDLTGVNLTKAKLIGASLMGAKLAKTDLTEADLRGADLRGADLTEAKLKGTNLEASKWYKDDILKFPQLKHAKFNYIIVEDQKEKEIYRYELVNDKLRLIKNMNC